MGHKGESDCFLGGHSRMKVVVGDVGRRNCELLTRGLMTMLKFETRSKNEVYLTKLSLILYSQKSHEDCATIIWCTL